jgi:hypothetical protein
MKKNRRMGTPKTTRKNARGDTPRSNIHKKPPHPFANYTADDIDRVLSAITIGDATDTGNVYIRHNVPRPGDTEPTERLIIITKSSGDTNHYKRRKGETTWQPED